jgi:hypothetical protein
MTARNDGLAARELQNDEFAACCLATESPQPPTSAQSSSAFTDLGDNRKLRRLRFTLLR